jgi:hypothetical protein
MATRFCRLLKAVLTGKRVDPVSPAIHDASKALARVGRATRTLEKELALADVQLAAAVAKCVR